MNALREEIAEFSRRASLAVVENDPEIYNECLDLIGVLEEIKEALRKRLIAAAVNLGQVTSEKGSRRTVSGSYTIEIRPWRTGFDPKKVEAMLRTRDLDPLEHMDAKVQFSVNEGKLAQLPLVTTVSQEQVESCRFDTAWALQRPTKTGVSK